jgi:endonuclease/exonuclease/phosphatase (EEP) superfamily protein YafD
MIARDDEQMRHTVLLIAVALGCDGSAAAPRFTVATYNVHADMAGDRATLFALRTLGADMVFLQEATPEWERDVRRELGDVYPHISFHPCDDRFGGLAVLSRTPFDDGLLLHGEAGPFPAWLVTVETAIGRLQILNLHLFPPVRWRKRGWWRAYVDSQDVHLHEVQGFLPSVDPRAQALILGDLNEAADGKAVAWLTGRGFVATLEPTTPTWHYQTELGTIRLQLDHILYRGALSLVASRVVNAGNSDHWPVVATFSRGSGDVLPRD